MSLLTKLKKIGVSADNVVQNMKRKKEKQNDTLSEAEIDLFNCDMRVLNDKEIFLKKIQEKIDK